MQPRTDAPSTALTFGPFTLLPAQKLLLQDGKPLRLGGRAFDLLVALANRAGEVIAKDQLIAEVWPTTFVEENNLRVHLTALRKILGDGRKGARFIVNVPGRGYSFIAPLGRTEEQQQEALPPEPATSRLPLPPAGMIGRDSELSALLEAVPRSRFVTITGAGGIGKSTLALAAAHQLKAAYADGAHHLDMATIEGLPQLLATFGALFGLSLPAEGGLAVLLGFLRNRNLLLLIDNCDRMVGPVAHLAEAVLDDAAGIDLLVTGREPLRAEGEEIMPLSPLATPEGHVTTAEAALSFPAVQLFVERAAESIGSFTLADRDAGAAVTLCRRLDGIPLAIELAAARVDMLGIHGLATRLDDLFPVLSSGLRNAPPRHRTLQAVMDWSYDLLGPTERKTLTRLSVFRSAFSMEAAIEVCCDDQLPEREAIAAIANLASKSLLVTDISNDSVQFRLLGVTRDYASLKLAGQDEPDTIRRRHALHIFQLLEHAKVQWEQMTPAGWRARYTLLVEDVRAALMWSFPADPAFGVRLTVAALPLGIQLALFDEVQGWGEKALAILAQENEPDRDAELALNTALSSIVLQTYAPARSDNYTSRALALATQSERPDLEVGSLVSNWAQAFGEGDYQQALGFSERLAAMAEGSNDPTVSITADRTLAQTLHYMGDHARSMPLVERVLQAGPKALPLNHSIAPVSPQVSMRIIKARILWVQGHAQEATDAASEALAIAANDAPMAVCQSLALAACPIAFWRGDLAAASSLVDRLTEQTTLIGASYWHSWAECYALALELIERRPAALPPSFAGGPKLMDMAATLTPALLTEQTVARAKAGLAGWCAPEILRLSALGGSDPQGTETRQTLVAAQQLAREQGALAWEARCTASIEALARGDAKAAFATGARAAG